MVHFNFAFNFHIFKYSLIGMYYAFNEKDKNLSEFRRNRQCSACLAGPKYLT